MMKRTIMYKEKRLTCIEQKIEMEYNIFFQYINC